MSTKLSEEEIEKRLIRLRNLETLHKRARQRIEKIKKENQQLRLNDREQKELIETLLLRIDELERKVFGSKGGGGSADNLDYSPKKNHKKKKAT